MKNIITIFLMTVIASNCSKKDVKDNTSKPPCDIQKTYSENSAKVTIKNGVWGTVSFMEGNCMPIIDPQTTTCKNCPVKRIVRIYQYTTENQAVKSGTISFYDSFSTQLVKQIETDDNGFFQTDLPAGKYTMVVIENGKLYTSSGDIYGGINPFTYSSGIEKINFTITYKAYF
jgi:hypothetical protein